MEKLKTKFISLEDMRYDIKNFKKSKNVYYAEIKFLRDRSSFAGMGFKINLKNKNEKIT